MKSLQNCFAFWIFLCGFSGIGQSLKVGVKNDLSFDRKEIVAISAAQFAQFLKSNPQKNIRIRNEKSELIPIQWIDYDSDGKPDELLFQAEVKSKSTSNYTLISDATFPETQTKISTFARFVPERSDDFAWENDKIAIRTYGPKGQQEAIEGKVGSTLSSGIDLWFKRVDYPIINNWYQKNLEIPGYYHTDRGEGYDPYHVGDSRGVGGIGVYVNDSLLVSKNFTNYKVIANGPLRSVFELTYAPWSRFGVQETKRISIDLGSNFSKFEMSLAAKVEVPNYTVGLTLHENTGETKISASRGVFRYWEAIDGIFVGEGIVIDPKNVISGFAKQSKIPDQSSILVVTKPNKKLIYYAGFAWQKSGQVSTVSDWDVMLERQSDIIANPLKVIVKKK